jgi:tetratricopeptide (TPR) repeat protein
MPLVASSPPGTSNQYLASNITSPHTVLRNPEISSAPPNPLPQHPDLMMVEPISPALDSIPPYPAGPIPSVIGAPTSGYIGQRPTPTRRYFPTLLPEPESGQGFEGHSSLFDSFLQTQLGQQPSVHPKPTCRLTEDTLRGELSIMETLFGRDHPETLSILLNLAEMLLDEGRYSHAEEIIRRLLDSYSNGYKDNEISRLEALQLLSVALWRQGLYVKAEEISLETIQSRKSLLGVTHPDTLQSMTILALNYNECGRIKEAEDLLVKIIEQGNRDSARKSGEALHCKQM